MRILVVSCGGTAAERPLRWLVEAGHQVCLMGDADFYADNSPANYRYVPSQWSVENDANPGGTFDEHQMAIDMAPRLRALFDEFQPDVVHTNAINWHARSCALAGVRPLIVSAWGFLNHLLTDNPSPEQQELAEFVLANSDTLIVETPQLLEPARALMADTAQVELIPIGAKTHLFRRGTTRNVAQWKRDLLDLPEETTVILSPRGWAALYKHDDIFHAYQLAYPHLTKPTAIVFLVMGRAPHEEQQEMRERIETRAKEYQLTDRLRFIPYFPHLWMPTLYNLSDVVISYPNTDAFPSTLIEAIACECEVISVDLKAYRGTFVPEVCTLVPPEHPEALAAAIVQVVNQPPESRQEHLAEARQLMVEQFDESRFRQLFFNACERLCAVKQSNHSEQLSHSDQASSLVPSA